MTQCPACGGKRLKREYIDRVSVQRCKRCDALLAEHIYLGDSYTLVKPYMATEPVPPEKLRYYDIYAVGSEGLKRRHGWYDPETRLIHQVG